MSELSIDNVFKRFGFEPCAIGSYNKYMVEFTAHDGSDKIVSSWKINIRGKLCLYVHRFVNDVDGSVKYLFVDYLRKPRVLDVFSTEEDIARFEKQLIKLGL